VKAGSEKPEAQSEKQEDESNKHKYYKQPDKVPPL
jgi:hypothetical protein